MRVLPLDSLKRKWAMGWSAMTASLKALVGEGLETEVTLPCALLAVRVKEVEPAGSKSMKSRSASPEAKVVAPLVMVMLTGSPTVPWSTSQWARRFPLEGSEVTWNPLISGAERAGEVRKAWFQKTTSVKVPEKDRTSVASKGGPKSFPSFPPERPPVEPGLLKRPALKVSFPDQFPKVPVMVMVSITGAAAPVFSMS